MEGKAVLFKKFANVNSIDIEVNTTDKGKLNIKTYYLLFLYRIYPLKIFLKFFTWYMLTVNYFTLIHIFELDIFVLFFFKFSTIF